MNPQFFPKHQQIFMGKNNNKKKNSGKSKPLSIHAGFSHVLQRGHKVTARRFANLRGLGPVRGSRFDVRGMPGDFLREALGKTGLDVKRWETTKRVVETPSETPLKKAPIGNVMSNYGLYQPKIFAPPGDLG